jgi:hypothetical protein
MALRVRDLRLRLIAAACALAAIAACALPDTTCTADTYQCNGNTLEYCEGHPAAVFGGATMPTYYKGAPSDWTTVADCGAGKCKVASPTSAFCALSSEPDPGCGAGCDGTTAVTCTSGYAVERQACAACGREGCTGGVDAQCTAAADCASGMVCAPDNGSGKSCALPCDCTDGATCPACDVLDEASVTPDSGTPFVWVCQAGMCSRSYQG